MKESEFEMINEQELAHTLKSFYCARSLPATRVDFLLHAKDRIAHPARPWRSPVFLQIAALAAAIVILFLVATREEHRRVIERAVCAEVVMNHLKHSPFEVISSALFRSPICVESARLFNRASKFDYTRDLPADRRSLLFNSGGASRSVAGARRSLR
jgi:hypothetical protein